MHSIKVGGDTFDAAIARGCATTSVLRIGPLTAERLKIERGYAGRPPGRDPFVVAGTDLQPAPAQARGRRALVAEAMRDGIDAIVRAAWSILEATRTGPRRRLDGAGIVLTGGGALIPGLAGEIAVSARTCRQRSRTIRFCVARGAGEILASPVCSSTCGRMPTG
jgi:rod shape-determining protein MreB